MFTLFVLAALMASVLGHSNPLLPKEWHHTKIATSAKGTNDPITSYFVTSSYPTSTSCGGEAVQVHGIGLGACIAGYDVCGNFLGTSTVYSVTKQSSSSIDYTSTIYFGSACTSNIKHTSFNLTVSAGCTASGSTGFTYAVVPAQNAWMGANVGVVVKTYESNECAESPAMWSSNSYNYCFFTQTCTGGSYSKYSECTATQATLNYYSDAACTAETGSAPLPVDKCSSSNNNPLYVSTINTCNN